MYKVQGGHCPRWARQRLPITIVSVSPVLRSFQCLKIQYNHAQCWTSRSCNWHCTIGEKERLTTTCLERGLNRLVFMEGQAVSLVPPQPIETFSENIWHIVHLKPSHLDNNTRTTEPQFAKNPFDYHRFLENLAHGQFALNHLWVGWGTEHLTVQEPKVKKIKINKNTLRCTNSATMHYQQK